MTTAEPATCVTCGATVSEKVRAYCEQHPECCKTGNPDQAAKRPTWWSHLLRKIFAEVEYVRELARKQIAPRAADYDRTGEFPWENVRAINALGLNAMFVPEAYGGAPLSYCAYLACVREVSAACASTGIIWATNFHGAKPLIDFGSEEQKTRLLPRVAQGGLVSLAITEPSAGSDATGMKTRFTPAGGEIVIDGGKTFITSGDVADLILLFGKWNGVDDERAAISALIVEKGTPGLSVVRLEDKMGLRASKTAMYAFTGVEVPDPQAQSTFERSRVTMSLGEVGRHAALRRWYQALLALRRRRQSLRAAS